MNNKNLDQLFQEYINHFEEYNTIHHEYYKWQVCKEFPSLMKDALAASKEEFQTALKRVRKCSDNLIDSYTQPFGGLVDCAGYEPLTVRSILKDLYADDGGDLRIQRKIIDDYFAHTGELLNKYFPDSFRYKQDFHAVSGLLFLNDPDHHYFFKSEQSNAVAEGIEFYNDWGSGTDIKLEVFYQMCDEMIEAIKDCPTLLDTAQSRFDGRLQLPGGELHPDTEKHILLFDIIYCSKRYNSYDVVSFKKRSAKEKQLYLERKKKAEEYLAAYENAKQKSDLLAEGLEYFSTLKRPGEKVIHFTKGEGIIESINEHRLVATFSGATMEFGLPTAIANGFIRFDTDGFAEKTDYYREVFKKERGIQLLLDNAIKNLEQYSEYLE